MTSAFPAITFTLLKQLIAILLLVIAGLTTFTPCCSGEEDTTTLQATDASHHAPDEGDEEACSPFASCARCCFGFTTLVHRVSLPDIPPSRPRHHSAGDAPLLPSPSFSIWQPPKATAGAC